jgi:hypothetical protein
MLCAIMTAGKDKCRSNGLLVAMLHWLLRPSWTILQGNMYRSILQFTYSFLAPKLYDPLSFVQILTKISELI